MRNNIDKKLSIVFLDFDDIKNPLLGAGQAKGTLEVGKRLVEKGHRVTVLCSRYPGYRNRIENGIKYQHIGLGTSNIKLNNMAYIFVTPFFVKRLKNVDIIVECFTAPITTLFSPLFTKTPVVAIPTSFEAERFSRLYHLPFCKIQNFGLKLYKYYISFSDFYEKKMKIINPHIFSTVIPEGVGDEFFLIKKLKPKHVLYLGRFDLGQKGIDLLLKAYSKIANKAKYPLIIAGKGPDENKIVKLIKELKLEEKVSMIGPTYGKKKNKYLSEAIFVAFPSRDETFSCFALEALAAGLPLVSFNIPGIEWTGEIVAKKAKPYDIDEYSKLLLSTMNEKHAQKLGKIARKFASHFTWNSVVDKYENFFFSVLRKEKINYAK